MLSAERGCGLKYDQEAIKAFIAARVRADDMNKFDSMLWSEAHAGALRVQELGRAEKAKTAYCAGIAREARTNKFMD